VERSLWSAGNSDMVIVELGSALLFGGVVCGWERVRSGECATGYTWVTVRDCRLPRCKLRLARDPDRKATFLQ